MTADLPQPLLPAPDDAVATTPRRAFLRRSLLGLTAIGLAPLLAACGGDDEDDEGDNADSSSGLDSDNAAATLPTENQQVGEDEEDPD